MNAVAPLGFALLGVIGTAMVLWSDAELEVKIAAIGVIGPLTGVAGGIAKQVSSDDKPPALRRRYRAPERPMNGDEEAW